MFETSDILNNTSVTVKRDQTRGQTSLNIKKIAKSGSLTSRNKETRWFTRREGWCGHFSSRKGSVRGDT